jgi:hypothetical protein
MTKEVEIIPLKLDEKKSRKRDKFRFLSKRLRSFKQPKNIIKTDGPNFNLDDLGRVKYLAIIFGFSIHTCFRE